MTEGLPFFPLLYPRVYQNPEITCRRIIIQGSNRDPRFLSLSLSRLGSSPPRRVLFPSPPSLSGPQSSPAHTREIRAPRSPINSLRALQFEFSTLCCREWNCPGMYPLAVKISAHLLGNVRKRLSFRSPGQPCPWRASFCFAKISPVRSSAELRVYICVYMYMYMYYTWNEYNGTSRKFLLQATFEISWDDKRCRWSFERI